MSFTETQINIVHELAKMIECIEVHCGGGVRLLSAVKFCHAVMWKQTAMWKQSAKGPYEVTLNIKI